MNAGSVLITAVLGPRGHQRMRASQSLLALTVYLLLAGVQHAEVLLGFIDATASWRLTAINLSMATVFYALIRSGLNQRVRSDPSLTLPQTSFALVVTVASYGITGPARGAVLTLLVLILVFTMFALRPSQSRALALLAFALLAGVMAYKIRSDPARYPPAVEAIHIVFAGVVLASVSVLAGRMGAMRARLRSQKLDLEDALARISELATRDELTGLVNRRHMNALMRAEQERQRRDGSGMAIALIDIDLFKHINDAHGHRAGDAVLKTFADTCGRGLRATDVLARWGGEEFLLMLPRTSLQQAQQTVERLREGLAGTSFDAVAPGLKVSFSAGLARCEGDASLEAGIESADQAMYRAKTQGRNCTVVAGTVAPAPTLAAIADARAAA